MKRILFFFSLAVPASALAQSYSIDWYKMAGGGGTSTNAQYSLTGTIGQPDASGALTGGTFTLTGGFWSIFAVPTAGAPILRIQLTGTNTAIVSWPSPSAGYDLQVNTDLATPNWTVPSETVVDNGALRYIIVNSPAGQRFYRLRHP